jgi:hypothetical protein
MLNNDHERIQSEPRQAATFASNGDKSFRSRLKADDDDDDNEDDETHELDEDETARLSDDRMKASAAKENTSTLQRVKSLTERNRQVGSSSSALTLQVLKKIFALGS